MSGRLDEIKHGNGRFSLLINQQNRLFGRVDTSVIERRKPPPSMGKTNDGGGDRSFQSEWPIPAD